MEMVLGLMLATMLMVLLLPLLAVFRPTTQNTISSCLDPGVTLDTTGYYMCVQDCYQDVIDLNPKPNNFIISIASASLSLADV